MLSESNADVIQTPLDNLVKEYMLNLDILNKNTKLS